MRLNSVITAASLVLVSGGIAPAQDEVRYDRDLDRTYVRYDTDRDWRNYRANEWSFDIFGTGTVGKSTLEDISRRKIERDGKLGMGIGMNYFFHRNVGIGAQAYTESTSDHFVDNVDGSLIVRFPLGESGLAPYGFGGGGRQFDPRIQWTWHAGGGLEFRFARHVGVFLDGRFVWADETRDYGLGRVGVRIGF